MRYEGQDGSERRWNPLTWNWVATLDQSRNGIQAIVFLVFFALYGWLAYTAGVRVLSPMEQSALIVIGVVVTGVFGAIMSAPAVARRLNINSQLRRAYGISQTLRALENDVREASERMKARVNLERESVCQLWEETAISIRASLREAILEAERITEDWGELSPDEATRIGDEEASRQREMDDLRAKVATGRQVEVDLAGTDRLPPEFTSQIRTWERRLDELESGLGASPRKIRSGAARDLLKRGHHRQAVAAYDEIIKQYPNVHTNYIGRARARYLAGDRAGALKDLDLAATLYPEDEAIEALRDQITSGNAPTAPLTRTASQAVRDGNEALGRGDGRAAMSYYVEAERLGLTRVYAELDKAMAAALAGEYQEACDLLGQFTPVSGTYFGVNAIALEAICRVLMGSDIAARIELLEGELSQVADFQYAPSPLRFLEAGLMRVKPEEYSRVRGVFQILKSEASPASGSHTPPEDAGECGATSPSATPASLGSTETCIANGETAEETTRQGRDSQRVSQPDASLHEIPHDNAVDSEDDDMSDRVQLDSA